MMSRRSASKFEGEVTECSQGRFLIDLHETYLCYHLSSDSCPINPTFSLVKDTW